MSLIECVPNFSEGRDKAKVDAIVEAMKVEGVYLLDREMDSDHNRCVITLVGDREAIAEAAIRGVGKAAELIDLTRHQGAHPRMGAADVVPFIPIEGVSLEDCVQIARHVGQDVLDLAGVDLDGNGLAPGTEDVGRYPALAPQEACFLPEYGAPGRFQGNLVVSHGIRLVPTQAT